MAIAEDIEGCADTWREENEATVGARKRDGRIGLVPRNAGILSHRGWSVVIGFRIELGQAERRRIGLAIVLEAKSVLHCQTAGNLPVVLGIEGENLVGHLLRRRRCKFGIAGLANAHQCVGVHVSGDERRPGSLAQVAPLPPVVLHVIDELPVDACLCGVRADDLGQILAGSGDLLVTGEGELIAHIP